MVRRDEVQAILAQAVMCPAEQLPGMLERECGGDLALRAEVQSLLRSLDSAGRFLAAPTASPSDGAVDDSGPRAATVSARGSEAGGTHIGVYRLLEKIGEGGFGTVFMAEQREPVQRRVALKIIKPGMDTQQVIARFEAERQALAMMDHPNIARVLDGGATGAQSPLGPGRPYFVMELVKGVPITRYCDEEQLGSRDRLALFVDVCYAVQHAHQKGVIHRDLKPSNVLVSRYDDKPVVKIIDFGVAKAIGGKLTDKTLFTELRQMIGTPTYMSPEQAGLSDLDVDTRSDIYSLGVLLYELLTGATPFDAARLHSADFDELRRIIREEEPPRPSTRLSRLFEPITAIGGRTERAAQAGATPNLSAATNFDSSLARSGLASTSRSEIARIAAARRCDPRALVRQLRGDLDWIVMKCLEKDRTRRYETASSLAADVQRHLTDEPVLAGPPSASYRIRKLVWRYRKLATAAVAVVLALAAGLGVALWQADRARQQAVKAEAISDFLQQTLAAADPFQELLDPELRARGLGPIARDRKLVDVVDQAAAALDSNEFREQPLVEAALRSTIGHVYGSLGHNTAALKHLRRAYDVQRELLGPENPKTLVTLVGLVEATGNAPGFDALLHSALQSVPRVLGPEHRATQALIQRNAEVLATGGHRDQAAQLLRDLLALQRRVLKEGDLHTLKTMDMLSWCLGEPRGVLEQAPEANRLAREALDIALRVHGPDSVPTHLARRFLVEVWPGDYNDEALELIRVALAGLEQHLGVAHPAAILARTDLATVLVRLQRDEDAEGLARANLDLAVGGLGIADQYTCDARSVLVDILLREQRFDEAESLALAGLRIARSPECPAKARCQQQMLWWLSKIYQQHSRLDDALSISRQGLELVSAQPQQGMFGRMTREWRDRLVYLLTQLKQFDEAMAMAGTLIEQTRAVRGDADVATLRALNGHAWALCEAGRLADAETLAREAVEGYRRVADPAVLGDRMRKEVLVDRINTTDTLAVVLCRLGRAAEAEPLFREIFGLLSRGAQPFRGDEGLHALHYGECLLSLQRHSEAQHWLLEALNAAARSPTEQAHNTLEAARQRLAELYEITGTSEKADEEGSTMEDARRP